jgi:hypothetical protein
VNCGQLGFHLISIKFEGKKNNCVTIQGYLNTCRRKQNGGPRCVICHDVLASEILDHQNLKGRNGHSMVNLMSKLSNILIEATVIYPRNFLAVLLPLME